jgi:putative ABC transport system permease protein
MQAATPAIEINRIYALMGTGTKALRWLALVIIIVSGLSIFISLYNSLKERRYELALMRVMGASRGKLLGLIVLEGLLLAVLGYALGMFLSHGAMYLLADQMKETYQYDFSWTNFLVEEAYLFGGALIIGLLAAIIPAIQARNTDISETLSEG